MSWRRRFRDLWGRGSTQSTLLLCCVVLCGLAYAECHLARLDTSAIRGTSEAQRDLSAAIAVRLEQQNALLMAYTRTQREPAKASYQDARGITIEVRTPPGDDEDPDEYRHRFARELAAMTDLIPVRPGD